MNVKMKVYQINLHLDPPAPLAPFVIVWRRSATITRHMPGEAYSFIPYTEASGNQKYDAHTYRLPPKRILRLVDKLGAYRDFEKSLADFVTYNVL